MVYCDWLRAGKFIPKFLIRFTWIACIVNLNTFALVFFSGTS